MWTVSSHASRIAILLALTAGPGCTVLATYFSTQPPACETVDDCFAGYACVQGACEETANPMQPPIVPPASIGGEGGTVMGPDGVELIIPEGALAGAATVVIERFSATLDPFGVDAQSRVYSIRPTLALQRSASLRIPAPDCTPSCRLFGNNNVFDVQFYEVPGSALIEQTVVGDINEFGLFVVGFERVPDDAGTDPEPDMIVDAGTSPDAGSVTDAGVLRFSACDLSPNSCNDDEACVPHPFRAGEGICLASAEACSAHCGCCGPLDDDPQAPSWCLPDELCGQGALGDSCASDGDCAAVATEGCLNVQGVQTCSRRCSAQTETSLCGDGCCLPDALDPTSGFCTNADDCLQPTGALCMSTAACQTGSCESTDGLSPPRCTLPCNIDEANDCASGLCCSVTNCNGAGLCVPQGQCDAQGLVCTDTCLADDACPNDGLCDRGHCIDRAQCGCIDHDDCGAGEHCDITSAIQASCIAGGNCCGTCVVTESPDCFVSEDCTPVDGGPALCRPSQAAGCEEDPFEQCPGACDTTPAACAQDDDCPGEQRCVQQECL